MNFLKTSTIAVFLATSAVAIGPIVMAPAQAATSEEINEARRLIELRIAQLEAQIAEQQAILDDPTSTPEEEIDAEAAIQRISARIAQLKSIDAVVETLPDDVLEDLTIYLQDLVSPA